jgi:membrane fusion protein (multidrug efflux system)
MRSGRRALVAGAALALAGACGGDAGGQKGGGAGGGGSRGGEGGGGGRPAPAVEVVVAAPRTITETREVTGTLAPVREARLVAQLEGAVLRVRVAEGDRVRAGQPLADIDATAQRAELDAARTRARVADAAAQRAARLLALGAASRAEQEEATAARRETLGALRAAEVRAGYGALRSPFDGLVTAVRVDVGDVVVARQEVMTVADVRVLRVEVPVSELDLVRLKEGDPVRATVDALPGAPLAARIRRVYPTVDPTSRQGVIEVSLPRAVPALVPGLLARLTLTVAEARDALAVPLDAVRRDVRDRAYVYVVRAAPPPDSARGGAKGEDGEQDGRQDGRQDGKQDAKQGGKSEPKGGGDARGDSARSGGGPPAPRTMVVRRSVVLGLRGGDNWVQVTRGLDAGDRVVVSGDQELSDSTRVRVLGGPARRGATGATGGGTGGGR